MNWSQLICFSSIEDELGVKHPYWKNPSKETLVNYLPTLKKRNPDGNEYRTIVEKDGDVHVWPTAAGMHEDLARSMGIYGQHASQSYGYITPILHDYPRNDYKELAITKVHRLHHDHPWFKKIGAVSDVSKDNPHANTLTVKL